MDEFQFASEEALLVREAVLQIGLDEAFALAGAYLLHVLLVQRQISAQNFQSYPVERCNRADCVYDIYSVA